MQKVEGFILALYYYQLILSAFPYGTISITPKANFYLLYFNKVNVLFNRFL